MTVAVVTPWINHLELRAEYDRAIQLGPPPDELIIVDNGSDQPLEFAAIWNDENQGFCKACNQGLHAAASDVIVFLNNDIVATEAGWLDELVDAVEPSVLAGARIRTDQHTVVDGVVYPYIDGWCLAGRRDDLLYLGGFDTSLEEPAYYSDNLLCLEARARGFNLRQADTGLLHLVGGSGPTDTSNQTAATRANHQRYQRRVRALVTKGSAAR
jgi:GT2 family glycosyltransferase